MNAKVILHLGSIRLSNNSNKTYKVYNKNVTNSCTIPVPYISGRRLTPGKDQTSAETRFKCSCNNACQNRNSSEQRVTSSEEKTVTSSENRVAREIKNPIYSLLSTHYYSSILNTHYSLLTIFGGNNV